ncbi:hypothetical protein EYR41_008671 [Orbilia oligospora]|uniref:Uncharacterized protein n=1 Tax=Orbilia oligospora TaxID=2813651 RepID=A0A7C8TSQ9_ORBOL|nr:hypothetical protein TWF751_002383 [Orbilia oligospora]TGJ67092.1 hypothetical protein EYR41_008671 [Orbilia oligospora]
MLRPFGPNHYASMASSAANAAAAAAIVSYLSPLFQTSVMISLSDPMHGLNPLTGPNQGRKMNIRKVSTFYFNIQGGRRRAYLTYFVSRYLQIEEGKSNVIE